MLEQKFQSEIEKTSTVINPKGYQIIDVLFHSTNDLWETDLGRIA